MPNIWGDGKLLTFSGIDGPTVGRTPSWAGQPPTPSASSWRLRPDVLLIFGGLLAGQEGRLVLGDAADLTARTPRGSGDLRLAFADCWTIGGEVTGSLEVRLEGADRD